MKVHRDWRIMGEADWLREIWPKVVSSLDYCINLWDPDHKGLLEEPHHNTFDIEFWGPDSMCNTIYLGALTAAVAMGRHLSEDVTLYQQLYDKGRKYQEDELFNGEYFFQKVRWRDLKSPGPVEIAFREITPKWGCKYSPEALEILDKEGPKYQYGTGCISDGVLGSWLAMVCGVGQVLDREPDDSGGRYRRAYTVDGRFVAILHRDKETGVWRPKKVFV